MNKLNANNKANIFSKHILSDLNANKDVYFNNNQKDFSFYFGAIARITSCAMF